MTVYPGDLLEVHNNEDYELKLTWDGRSFLVGPHRKRMVPFEQVVNHFGHPYAGAEEHKVSDESGVWHVVPTREDERARVSLKGGWDIGSTRTGGLQVLVRPPNVEIFDQDGNRVWTVLEDPDGSHQGQGPAAVDPLGDNREQIARLTRQLKALEMQVEANSRDLHVPDAAPAGDLPDLDVPVDE